MNITDIELIFLRKTKEAIEEINDSNIKVTLLKKISSQSIDAVLGRKVYNGLNPASISAMFSGRGRAWARVDNTNNNLVWQLIESALCKDNKSHLDLFDLFEQTGFAWMRYSSCMRGTTIAFDLRYLGSKLEDCVKCYIPFALINHITNLDGVPHKLGLELGVLKKSSFKKDKIDIPVPDEDLNTLGIQLIEDII